MGVRIPLVVINGRVSELPSDEKIKNCTETLEFEFLIPALEWVITHNLGKRATITTTDLNNQQIFGAVSYDGGDNVIRVKFAYPVAGYAYIN